MTSRPGPCLRPTGIHHAQPERAPTRWQQTGSTRGTPVTRRSPWRLIVVTLSTKTGTTSTTTNMTSTTTSTVKTLKWPAEDRENHMLLALPSRRPPPATPRAAMPPPLLTPTSSHVPSVGAFSAASPSSRKSRGRTSTGMGRNGPSRLSWPWPPPPPPWGPASSSVSAPAPILGGCKSGPLTGASSCPPFHVG